MRVDPNPLCLASLQRMKCGHRDRNKGGQCGVKMGYTTGASISPGRLMTAATKIAGQGSGTLSVEETNPDDTLILNF